MSGKDGKVKPPTTAELIRREAKIEKGSRAPGKEYVGNLTIESAIRIAKEKMGDSGAKELKSALKSVVGTCQSMGIRIDGKDPEVFLSELDKGAYDSYLSDSYQ